MKNYPHVKCKRQSVSQQWKIKKSATNDISIRRYAGTGVEEKEISMQQCTLKIPAMDQEIVTYQATAVLYVLANNIYFLLT